MAGVRPRDNGKLDTGSQSNCTESMGIVDLLIDESKTSFLAKFINPTTVLIIEDDSYNEQPHIYVKIYPDLLIITDTGCNSPRLKNKTITTLRTFLETVSVSYPTSWPLSAIEKMPLNPSSRKKYLILCTHVHYDHILGIPSFIPANPAIVASSYCRSFIENDLPTHSLCNYLHIPTPSYTISHWAQHLEYLSNPNLSSHPLRIRLLHIPGHTPDSLAWYDTEEHHLYVGDTFYARKRAKGSLGDRDGDVLPQQDAAIIFPREGNWIDYLSSLDLLVSFVQHENKELQRQHNYENGGEVKRVKVGCGHVTASGDAETMSLEVRELFWGIVRRRVTLVRSWVKRGEVFDFWMESEDANFSVEAPRRLVEEARDYFDVKRGGLDIEMVVK